MPGIYTHNYIFRKSVENILKTRNRSYISRSIETLYSTPEHFKAGLFGAIGPNIFDYMNIRQKDESYAHEITFALHDKGCIPFLQQMTGIVMNNRDSRNEWSTVQRAYLLGYLSHVIADSILHPYIFYSSGFPDKMEMRQISYYRKMNLRFQYNIDNYFLYRDDSGPVIKYVDEMIPVNIVKGKRIIWPSIKYLILESLKRGDEPLFSKHFADIKQKKIDGDTGKVKYFDRIPSGISLSYKIKRTENQRWINAIDKLCENPLTYSDFFVRYPSPKRVDEDALNIHQGRWQYPATQRGFRYESVIHLVRIAIEQVVRIWELAETAVYENKSSYLDELDFSSAYTGEKGVFFDEMKIKDPVKLKV